MFDDYLNEVIFWTGKRNRRNNTYKAAMQLKKQGDSYIFNLLCTEWCSCFHWDYDPADERKTIATELIERTILMNSACGFGRLRQENGSFIDETWRNFRPTGMGNESFYAYPSKVDFCDYVGRHIGTYIPAQQQEDSGIANAALVYDNFMGWNPISIIIYYTQRLSTISTSINACIANILGTSAITCTREQAREIERQRQSAAVGVPYLIQYDEDGMAPKDPKLLSTPGASEELKTLFESWDKVHADYLQCIGIRVGNEMNKKSGVTPMEIVENRMNVDVILNARYRARLKGIEMCEKIGLTGLSVSLDNFENLVGDYDKNGNRITNVDPEASGVNKEVDE